MVVRFYAIPLPSAKCPRPPGKPEISKWTKIWGIIQRTKCTIWCTVGKSPKLRKRHSEERKYYQESFQDMLSSRGNLERRHSGCWYWRIGKVGRIRNLSQKIECIRSPDNPQRLRMCTSCGRWFSNIIRKRLRIARTLSETGTHRKERESQRRISRRWGRVSTWRNKRWRRNT